MSKITEALRIAVKASEKSRYRLAKDSGLAESALSRLVSGERSVTIESAERLAEALGLELVIQPKGRGSGKGK